MATKARSAGAAKAPLKLSDYINEYETVARRGEVWGLLEWFWNQCILGNLPHRLFWRWVTRKPFVVFNPWKLSRLAQAQKEAKLEGTEPKTSSPTPGGNKLELASR